MRVTVLAHTAIVRSSALLLPKPSFTEVYYLGTEVSLQHLSHACASMDSMSAHGNDEIWFFLREVNRCQRQQYLRGVSGSADVSLDRCMMPCVMAQLSVIFWIVQLQHVEQDDLPLDSGARRCFPV